MADQLGRSFHASTLSYAGSSGRSEVVRDCETERHRAGSLSLEAMCRLWAGCSIVLDPKRSAIPRRDGRVAEGARLESVYTARYPGFSLEHLESKVCARQLIPRKV